jgi:Flp pilus assembly pilin Flp
MQSGRTRRRIMMRLRNRKGQSTLEYVLIAAAVITLIVIMLNKIKKPANDKITDIANGLSTSTQ